MHEAINILVIGSGGREHALCWKLAQSPLAQRIYCAPGNGGTATTAKTSNVPLDISDFHAVTTFAEKNDIDFAVIGPDNPLADGIVDTFEAAGLRTFGPTQAAAKLEWSKGHAKQFMEAHGIPTARFQICESVNQARAAVLSNRWARVIKADGLALGKGVFVCDTTDDALKAIAKLFEDAGKPAATHGVALHSQERAQSQGGDNSEGKTSVVVEERLYGEEISLMCLCDGKTIVPLLPCQDHKRRFDNDLGPNTGGMGVYAPIDLYTQYESAIRQEIIEPLIPALAGHYKGVLYIGLLIAEGRPYVLEFNARFGDPETQCVLPLLKSDLLQILWACTEGKLAEQRIEWSTDSSCCVVAVAKDYPEKSSKGEVITLPDGERVTLFQAGTKLTERGLETNGGRIFSVTGMAPDMESAREIAYGALTKSAFNGMDYRKDIAGRAVATCL